MYDKKTGGNILQWPVEEVESLRSDSFEFNDVKLAPGSITPLQVNSPSQVCLFFFFFFQKYSYNNLVWI